MADIMTERAVKRIRHEMTRQGLTISELAERAQVGRPYLSNVLAGYHSPSVDWLARVLGVLGVEIDAVFMTRTAGGR